MDQMNKHETQTSRKSLNDADKETQRYFRQMLSKYEQMTNEMEILEQKMQSCDTYPYDDWAKLRIQYDKLEEETELYRLHMIEEYNAYQNDDSSMDGQETTTTDTQPEIEPKSENEREQIDVKKSDDEMNQIIESVETESYADDLLQVQQQQEPQYQTIFQQQQDVQQVQPRIQAPQQLPQSQQQQRKSQDSMIKMTDIYKKEDKLWQTVISEIEGRNIKPMEIYTRDELTLGQEQMSPVKVEKADTFRGGTELIFNPRKIKLQFEE